MDESDQQKTKKKKVKKVKKKKTKIDQSSSSTTELNIQTPENIQNIKNFFNQSPPKSGVQWTDDIFPPNNNSILNNSQKFNDLFECEENNIDISEIEWKRISEMEK